jgi:type IV pilus assembly protein PilF
MIKLTRFVGIVFCSVLLTACASSGDNPALSSSAKQQAAKINVQLGMSYLAQNYNDLAKKKLLKALELDPNSAEAHAALGDYYAQVKDPAAANQEYQRALSLSPRDSIILDSYGVFLCNTHQYESANDYFMRAVAQPAYTSAGNSYLNAAICAQQAGNNTRAQAYFQKAIDLNPQLALPYLKLGEFAYDNSQYFTAKNYLDQYNSLAAPTAESLQLGIAVAEKLGDANTAASLRLLLQAKFPTAVLS